MILLWFAVAAAYDGAAHTGFAFAFAIKQVSAVWPASGVALAALILGGQRLWPGVLLGAFIANVTSAEPAGTAAVIAVGSTAEAVVGAWLIRRIHGFRPALERARDVLAVVCLAAFASTIIGATVGVAALWSAGLVSSDDATAVWRVWWRGEAGGALIVAPALLVFGALIRDGGRAAWSVIVQSAVAAAVLAIFGLVVFRSGEPIVFVLFPVVFAIALLWRQPGTTLSTLALASVAVWETGHGIGQFAVEADPDTALMQAQTFVGVLSAVSLLLTAFRTERERAEAAEKEQRALNRDLAAASEAKSRFLANVSHELRTPIHVIGGFAATLLSERAGPLTPAQRDQLQAIQRSGDHLNSLITELIELARHEAGKAPLQITPVKCSEVMRDVANEMCQMASDKGLRLDLDATVPAVVHTDRKALRQILINLTGNAIKFTDVGQIRLGVAEGSDESVLLTVTDTGPGIAETERDRLFEAFEQGGRSAEGLGLGLYISRSLADRLGAQISLRSVPGWGSEFTLELPPKPRPAPLADAVA